MAPKKKPKKLSLGPAPLASFDTELESEADQQSNSDEGSSSSEESKSQTGSIKQESSALSNDQVGEDTDTPTPTNQDIEGIMDFPSQEVNDTEAIQDEFIVETPKQEVQTSFLDGYKSQISEESSSHQVPQEDDIQTQDTVSKQVVVQEPKVQDSMLADVGTKIKIPVRAAPKVPPIKKVETGIESDQIEEVKTDKIKLEDRIEKIISKDIEVDRNGISEKSDTSIEDKPKSPLAQMKKKMLWGNSPPKFGAIPKISLTKSLRKEDKGESIGKQLHKTEDGKKIKKDDKKKEKIEEKQRLEKLKEEKKLEEKKKEELKKSKMREEKRKKEEKRKAEEKRRDEKRKEDKKLQELKLEQKKKAKKKKEIVVKEREKVEEIVQEFKKVSKESLKRKGKLEEKEEIEIIEKVSSPVPIINGEIEILDEQIDDVISDVNIVVHEEIVTVAIIETESKPTREIIADEKEAKESESSDEERELTESEVEVEPVQQDIPKIEDAEHAEIADKLITQESVDYDDEQFPMLENIPVTPTLTPIITPRKRFDIVTVPIQRPRANTPIQIASLEDYITIASGVEKSHEVEKIKILLPEEEFIAKPTKSPKRTSSKSWFDFCEGGLQSPRILRSPQLSDSSSPTIGSPAGLPLSPRAEVKTSKSWVMFSENEVKSPVAPEAETRLSDEEVEVFVEDGNISADIESTTEDDSQKEQIICRIKLKTRHLSEEHSSEEETTYKKEDDGSSSDSDETIHNSEESLGESDSTLEDGWQAFERTRAVKVGVKKGDRLTNEMLLPNRGRLGSTGVTDGETDLEPVWVDSPDFFTQSGEVVLSEEHLPSPEEILNEVEIVKSDEDANQSLKRQDTKGRILMKQSRALDIEDKFLVETIIQERTIELENELTITDLKYMKDDILGPVIAEESAEAEIHSILESLKDEADEKLEICVEEKSETVIESPLPAYDFLNVELHIVESSENIVDMTNMEGNDTDIIQELTDEMPPVKSEIPSAASYPQLPIDIISSDSNVLSKAYTSIDRVNELDSGLYSWTRTTTHSATETGSETDLKSEENTRTYSLGELTALTEEAKLEDKDEEEHEESIEEAVFSSEPSYISFSLDQHPFEVVDREHPVARLFAEEVDYSYVVDESIPHVEKTDFEVTEDYSLYQPTDTELTQEYQQELTYSSYQDQELAQVHPSDWDAAAEEMVSERISKVKFEEPTHSTILYLPSSDEPHIEDVAEQEEIVDAFQEAQNEIESSETCFVYSGPFSYSPETRPPPPEESPPPPPEESPSPPPDEISVPPTVQPDSRIKPVRKAPPPPPKKTFEYEESQYNYDSSQYPYDYGPTDQFYTAGVYGDAPPPSTATVEPSQLIAPTGQLSSSFLNLFDPVASVLDLSKSQTNGAQLELAFPTVETPEVNGQNLFEEVFLPMKLPPSAAVPSEWEQSQQPVTDIFETLQEIQGELPPPPIPPAAKIDDWPTGTFTRRDSGIRFPRKQVRTESQADIDDFVGGPSEAVSQPKVAHDDLLKLEDQEQVAAKAYDSQEESTFHEGKPKNVFKALADIKPWKKKKKKFRPKPVNLAKLVGSEHVMTSKKKKKGKGVDSEDRLYDSFSSIPHQDESIDKESEDWLAFQRMTQRASETVQKTKTNLDKIVISSAVDSRATIKKIEPEKEQFEIKSTKPSWVCFDDDFISSSGDSSAAPSRIDTPTHTPNVHSPKPPRNSLRNSLTDLSQEAVEESVDILGLGDILPQTTTSTSKSILEQDLNLLGLGCESFTEIKPVSRSKISLMDDPFGLENTTVTSQTVIHSKDLFDFEDSGAPSMASQPELFEITPATSKSSSDMGVWDIFGSTPAPVKEKQSDALFMDPFYVSIPENITAKSWAMPDASLEDTPFTDSPKLSPRHSLTSSITSSPSRTGWSTFDEGKVKQTPPSSRKASSVFQDPFAFPTSTTTPTKQNVFSMSSTQAVSKSVDPFLITDSLTTISTSLTDPFHSAQQTIDPFSHLDSKSALPKSTESDPFDTMHILDQHKSNLWMGFETSDTMQTATIITSSSQTAASDPFESLSSSTSSREQFGTSSMHDLFGTGVHSAAAQDLLSASISTSHGLFSSAPAPLSTTTDFFEPKSLSDPSKDVSWQAFGSTAFTKTDKDDPFDTVQVTIAPAAPAWPSFDESDTMDTTTLIPKSSPKEHDVKSVSKVASDAWPTDSGIVESKTKVSIDPFSSGRDSDPLLSHSDAAADPFNDSVSDWTKHINNVSETRQEQLESPDKSESFDQTSSFSQLSSKAEMAFTSDDSFGLQKSSAKVSEGLFDFDDSDSPVSSQKINHSEHSDPFAFTGLPETDSTSQNPFAVSMEPIPENVSHNPFLQPADQEFGDVDTCLDSAPVESASSFHGDMQNLTLSQPSDDFYSFTTTKSPAATPARIAPLPPPLKLAQTTETTSEFDVFDTKKSGPPVSSKQMVQGFDNDSFDPFAVSKTSVDAFGLDQFGDDSDGLTSPPASQTRFNPFDKEVAFTEGVVSELPQATDEPEVPESPCSYKPESPLFDEDDSEPLEDFPPKWEGDGWEMMLRLPSKKKITGSRCWKKVYVRLADNNVVQLFNSKDETEPFQELPLQACYSVSHVAAQQYDAYGKIHTIKLQYVFYRERVGIRPGQIPKLTQGHITKLGLPLEHAPQTSQLMKLGSQSYDELKVFINVLEDALMRLPAQRERSLTYRQEEIQFYAQDEFFCYVLKNGEVQHRNARVRVFCLSFISGMPDCELGLNDILKRGKEVVSRYDIIPIKTEEWIRIEQPEFHSCVMQEEFENTRTVKFHPLDACQFEIMRFRIRPPRNRELPLHVKCLMTITGSHIELRSDVMVSGYYSRKSDQPPCEDIQIRIPIPEPWVYLFRVEKRFGYGSVKSAIKKPGKIKGLERLKAAGFTGEANLIEVSTGSAKYEHAFRAIVWRISRLPERNQGAYSTQLLVCRLELASYDEIPENFCQYADVEFVMPMTTASHSTVRSISVANSTPPEKFVRYLGKYEYKIEIEHTVGSESSVGDTSSS